MKVIFYVLDLVKTVLRHICMLCEHFRQHHNTASNKQQNAEVMNNEIVKDKDFKTRKDDSNEEE